MDDKFKDKEKLLEYIYENIDGFVYYNRHKERIKKVFFWHIIKYLEDNSECSSRWFIYENWMYKDLPIDNQSLFLIQQVYLIIK